MKSIYYFLNITYDIYAIININYAIKTHGEINKYTNFFLMD